MNIYIFWSETLFLCVIFFSFTEYIVGVFFVSIFTSIKLQKKARREKRMVWFVGRFCYFLQFWSECAWHWIFEKLCFFFEKRKKIQIVRRLEWVLWHGYSEVMTFKKVFFFRKKGINLESLFFKIHARILSK